MKVQLHSSIKGISGTMDDWVYRQVGDQVFASPKGSRPKTPPSAAQTVQRQRFAAAVAYAQSVLADPCQREIYEELGRRQNRRPDKLLTGDFMSAPEIRRIDLSGFHGRVGDRIRVIAFDDIEVVSVNLRLEIGGTVIASGPASCGHGVWDYVLGQEIAPGQELVNVTAIARDRPGNETTMTVVAKTGSE